MEFRILGPLEVLDGGHVLDVGGAKQRGLLAKLCTVAARAGGAGDREHADELLEQALTTCRRLGMTRAEARASALTPAA
jgi:hypothetical protein